MVGLLLTTLALGQVAGPIPKLAPFPEGRAETINLVTWDGNTFPRPIQRSDQPPFSDDELKALLQAGIDGPQLVKLIEERRCACDASAGGLIALKNAGAGKDVLAAVSLHALAPNRALELQVTFDFTGDSRTAQKSHLYFFVDDGALTRVFTADLNALLSGTHRSDTHVDRSDLLITRRVRRVQFSGVLPLKTFGPHRLLVAASANPMLTHPSQLSEPERRTAQSYAFDYPRSSLQSVCRLSAGFKRDALLLDVWRYMGSRFECEWN